MAAYLLTAVTTEGFGLTYHWGDTYEVQADSYDAAEADVLGRVGAADQPPYDRIVKAWVRDGNGIWTELPLAARMTQEKLALTVVCPACRAGTGEQCLRLRAIGASRVRTRYRILHPHAIRIAKAKKSGEL